VLGSVVGRRKGKGNQYLLGRSTRIDSEEREREAKEIV
jgi:hypothetical protein